MGKIKNRVDVQFLTEVLSIQSHSKDDADMLTFIKNRLALINVTVEEDGYKNIYVTKGHANDYPCLVAHTDTVHSIVENFSVFKDGDLLFAFDSEKGKQCGIGGDDKVGVYTVLQALLDVPIMKAVFFRDEEIGCVGSHYSILNHKDWYANCNYVIEPDRRNFYDLITNSNGLDITSKEFIEETEEIAERYGYKESIGVSSDIDTLASGGVGVSCLNISCGYLNPHSSSEVVSIIGVNAAYNYIYDVIAEFPHRKFAHTPPPRPVYKWKKDEGYYSSLFKDKQKREGNEQLQLFGPHELSNVYGYQELLEFDNFTLSGETKDKTKLYKYIGIKAIPFTVDVACGKCKESSTLFYMPYEGRIFCTKCNDFASNEEDLDLFKYLEIDDTETTFVFSVYADSWMVKETARWDDTLKCWVPDNMPF